MYTSLVYNSRLHLRYTYTDVRYGRRGTVHTRAFARREGRSRGAARRGGPLAAGAACRGLSGAVFEAAAAAAAA